MAEEIKMRYDEDDRYRERWALMTVNLHKLLESHNPMNRPIANFVATKNDARRLVASWNALRHVPLEELECDGLMAVPEVIEKI